MSKEVYRRLAQVLDTLPNGFPATDDGLEIRLLKKIFTPEEADLFCDLRMKFETPDQVAERTGRPREGLDRMLTAMWRRGQLFGVDFGTARVFKIMPWIFGIYEFQLDRMDREFAAMCEEYNRKFGPQFFRYKPQLMQVVPVEKTLPAAQTVLPYDHVSAIIDKGQSFAVAQCICKKEQGLLDKGCDNPQEVCLGIAPVPNIFENHHWGRPISREDAYEVLRISEEAGLVHLTHNVESGHFFVCNCCGCCCLALRSIRELGLTDGVNRRFEARIDPEACTACGLCADERCQVEAISEHEGVYRVDARRCIGCGLCVTTCPEEAVTLVSRPPEAHLPPPPNEDTWFRQRGKDRGVEWGQYR